MLEYLHLKNVGPARELTMELAPRFNVITGDNGLGKSFLLDIAWWALTRRWPSEVNPRLTSGMKALPYERGAATIEFRFTGKKKRDSYTSTFDRMAQAWTGRAGRPAHPGLVLYAQADGGFAVWDPARNYWRKQGNVDVQERQPAYVFAPGDVWMACGTSRSCSAPDSSLTGHSGNARVVRRFNSSALYLRRWRPTRTRP